MTLIRSLTSAAALAVAATLAQGVAHGADMPIKARPALPVVDQGASGYIEVYGGWSTTEFSVFGPTLGDLDGWVLGGAGRGNYWLAPNMSMQLDAQAEGTSYKFSGFGPFGTSINTSSHSYLIGGHFNWRDSQRGLLGVFAAAGDQGGGFIFDESRRHVIFGGEGQIYWNQFTLYVQGGYDTTVGTHFIEPEAWFIRGTGRYFFTPNTMLEGTVLYADGEIKPGFTIGPVPSIDYSTLLWEAKLEHRFAATPFSLYLKYRGTETKFETPFAGPGINDFKVTEHRILAGLRLYMGQNTLLSNDRQGATLDIKDTQSLLLPLAPEL